MYTLVQCSSFGGMQNMLHKTCLCLGRPSSGLWCLAWQNVACDNTYSVRAGLSTYTEYIWEVKHHSSCLNHTKCYAKHWHNTDWFEKESKCHLVSAMGHCLLFGSCSSSASSNQKNDPGPESPWCANQWRASRVSLCATLLAFKTEREMTHQTLVTVSCPPSCPSTAPENCSDGPMIYLTHADVFCIKAAEMLQCTSLVEKSSSSRDLEVLSSLKHFLHHRFCLAEDGEVANSKQAGYVLVKVGHEKMNSLFPDSCDTQNLKSSKSSSH